MLSKIFFILSLISGLSACAQVNKPKALVMVKHELSNVSVFTSNFANYSMDIQAAGLATIPHATISDKGILYIEYSYKSGSENRNGRMTLEENKSNNRFEGEWKTDADNGNSYQGTLYFVFNENGTANGYYQFGGSDYKITILKK